MQEKKMELNAEMEIERRATSNSVLGNHEPEHISCVHFMNINEDPLLSGQIRHLIKEGEQKVGRRGEIKISGLGIGSEHAVTRFNSTDNDPFSISPLDPEKCKIKVNGHEIQERTTLQHGDHILFGNNNLFLVVFPEQELTEEMQDYE